MKIILIWFLMVCTMVAGATFSYTTAKAEEVEHISKEELSTKLCTPNLMLLDVRSEDMWEKSKIKIKCAVRVDSKNVESWIDTIPMDKEIVLYCCT